MKEQRRTDKFNSKLSQYMNDMEEERKKEQEKMEARMKKTIQRKMFEFIQQKQQQETEVTEDPKTSFWRRK